MTPSADNRVPCADNPIFLSTLLPDHTHARAICETCPFTSWCIAEREASAQAHGRGAVEGTWHGSLWVDGVLSVKGRRFSHTTPGTGAA